MLVIKYPMRGKIDKRITYSKCKIKTISTLYVYWFELFSLGVVPIEKRYTFLKQKSNHFSVMNKLECTTVNQDNLANKDIDMGRKYPLLINF